MRLKVWRASDPDAPPVEWAIDTVEDLLQKVEECGHDIIITYDGEVTIYDDYVE